VERDVGEVPPVSVRNALLALLEQGPRYGYQLRAEFEDRTGGTWPLNVGQVYTTLSRLERDGFVEGRGADRDGHVVYAVTTRGRDEVAAWFSSPVPRTQPPREELAIKLALAVSVPGIEVGTVIQQQRSATMAALQDYTRLKRRATGDDPHELAWGLVIDSLVFNAEAEIRWLDHCEARLRRAARDRDDRGERVVSTGSTDAPGSASSAPGSAPGSASVAPGSPSVEPVETTEAQR
jgi:DNA-binding PadR family transcriptional regulator